MKTKALFVFLSTQRKIQAQKRQMTMGTIPKAKEGDATADRRIPAARLRVRKRKGKSMLHTIDGGPHQCVSDAPGSRTKDDT